jgi:hypothetical protein
MGERESVRGERIVKGEREGEVIEALHFFSPIHS